MFDYIRSFGWLNRDAKLYLLGFGLNSFAYFGTIGVLFNLYLVRLGFGAEYIGLLIGSGQLVWAAMALPAAAIAARIGITRALALSEVLIASGFSVVLLAEWLPRSLWEEGLFAGWVILWIGAALLTVNGVPFLMAVTNAEERSRAFSLLPAMIALFTFAGSLVAGVLPGVLADWLRTTLDDAAPYRVALWLAPLGFVLAGLHFAALRPVTVMSKHDGMEPRAVVPMREFVVFTAIIYFAACGEGAVRNFFNLYLDRQLHIATAQIGAVIGFAQLLPVATALLTPLILARLGTSMTLAGAILFSALCIATMGLIPHGFVAAAMLMAVMGMSAVAGPSQNLFSQEIVSPRWRTTISALSTVGMASGWATAAAMGGYVIATVGFSTFFLLCATLSLTSATVVLVYVRRTQAARSRAVVAVK